MIVYLYNSDNIYTGEHKCQYSPREDKFLIPLNSTDKKPTLIQSKLTKWNGLAWEYIDDIRGIYYHTVTKSTVIVEDINADLSELTKLKPNSYYDEWNGSAWVENTVEKTKAEALSKLNELDRKIPRGIEDLYIALKLKGIISDSDLPEEFLNNYNQKITERAKL